MSRQSRSLTFSNATAAQSFGQEQAASGESWSTPLVTHSLQFEVKLDETPPRIPEEMVPSPCPLLEDLFLVAARGVEPISSELQKQIASAGLEEVEIGIIQFDSGNRPDAHSVAFKIINSLRQALGRPVLTPVPVSDDAAGMRPAKPKPRLVCQVCASDRENPDSTARIPQKARQHFAAKHLGRKVWICPFQRCDAEGARIDDFKRDHVSKVHLVDWNCSRKQGRDTRVRGGRRKEKGEGAILSSPPFYPTLVSRLPSRGAVSTSVSGPRTNTRSAPPFSIRGGGPHNPALVEWKTQKERRNTFSGPTHLLTEQSTRQMGSSFSPQSNIGEEINVTTVAEAQTSPFISQAAMAPSSTGWSYSRTSPFMHPTGQNPTPAFSEISVFPRSSASPHQDLLTPTLSPGGWTESYEVTPMIDTQVTQSFIGLSCPAELGCFDSNDYAMESLLYAEEPMALPFFAKQFL